LWIRIWMEEGSREGVTELRIPRKVGNRNTVSFPVTILLKWAVSCRWIACNEYRNNDTSPLFWFATQKKYMCLSSKNGVQNSAVHWLGYGSNGPGLESRTG
jgi:hypothetical protein